MVDKELPLGADHGPVDQKGIPRVCRGTVHELLWSVLSGDSARMGAWIGASRIAQGRLFGQGRICGGAMLAAATDLNLASAQIQPAGSPRRHWKEAPARGEGAPCPHPRLLLGDGE